MRVVVASGKGGTGKTVLATSLAWVLAERGVRAAYADADVEEPNGHLFLWPSWARVDRLTVPGPALRDGKCSGCGSCQQACAFHAILALGDRVLTFSELCHSCGACVRACPEGSLREQPREIGTIRSGRAGRIGVVDGVLDVGQPRAAPLVAAVLESLPAGPLAVVDAPPGTSCTVVAALRGADAAILVTEPTPIGLHDLALALRLVRALGVPPLAVINRSDMGDDRVRTYLQRERVPVVAEVPYMPEIARSYARGWIAARDVPPFRLVVERLAAVLAANGREARA